MNDHRRDLAVAGFLILTLFACYMATGSWPFGDGLNYLRVGESLLERGSLKEEINHKDPNGQVIHVADRYSKYPLGQTLLELPVLTLIMMFKPRPMFAVLLLNLLPALECALIAALIYLLLRLPGSGGGPPLLTRRVAAFLALAAGLGTQLWPYASTHFADTSAALLTCAAFYLVLRFLRAGAGVWTLILAAWAMGLAFFCKNTYLLVWPALVGYGAWAFWARRAQLRRPVRSVLFCALPLVLALAAQFWFNYLRYGSIWVAGYIEDRDAAYGFSTLLVTGLYGIFFSSGRSLFLYSPLCLMAFFGWREMARRRPAELGLAAGIAVPLTLLYACWWSWYGGWEWGCRFYLFLVPLLIWISAPSWSWLSAAGRPPGFWFRSALLLLLLGVSLFIQLLGVLISPKACWNINASQLQVLKEPLSQPGVFESPDDMALVHFIPEFSPVPFNAWMLWGAWNRHRLSDAEIARHAPTSRLNPKWTPAQVAPYLVYNIWPAQEWDGSGNPRPLIVAILSLLALLAALGLTFTLRLTKNMECARTKPL